MNRFIYRVRDRLVHVRNHVLATLLLVLTKILPLQPLRHWLGQKVSQWVDQWVTNRKAVLGEEMAAQVEAVKNGRYLAENLRALQALADRRFEAVALPGPATAPTHWPCIDVSIATDPSNDLIEPFIQSLLAQGYPLSRMHLYITEGGSTKRTATAMQTALAPHLPKFASVSFVGRHNTDFGSAHRQGIRAGKSAWCLVTNTDITLSANSLTCVVATALSDADANTASWELRQVPHEQPKHYDPVTLEVNWSSHACVLLRRAAYDAVGGYDRRMFKYAADIELSYRFRSFGYVLKYVPKAVVHNNFATPANNVTTVQGANRIFGNLAIRLRYGCEPDREAALSFYADLLAMPVPFPGARRKFLAYGFRLLRNRQYWPQGRGPVAAHFPFRVFDYEMPREGAQLPVIPTASNNLPLVSVITRSYQGRGQLLNQAMQSVFNQTYTPIELIVVQDGADTLQAQVMQAADRAPAGCTIRFLANPKLGRSAAGNAGLSAATGRYLMFLDDDDLLYADHIETLAGNLLRDEQLAASYALATEVLTDSQDNGRYLETTFQIPDRFYQDWSHKVMLDHNFIPIQAILFRRELFQERGGLDEALEHLEDWHLWIRYGYRNKFAYVPKVTSLFRTPANSEVRREREISFSAVDVDVLQHAKNALLAIDAANAAPNGG